MDLRSRRRKEAEFFEIPKLSASLRRRLRILRSQSRAEEGAIAGNGVRDLAHRQRGSVGRDREPIHEICA
jgi:hypothetical protein